MSDFETLDPRRTDRYGMTEPGMRVRKSDGRFSIGDLVMNRYKIISELGQGGMGVVYRCFDQIAGIEVALKALPPELSHNTLEMDDIKDNFQLVSKLVHQNIAISKNLERDESNGNYYLIMECVEGEDLRRWIKRKRKEDSLSLQEVFSVIRQVAGALDYAHKQKVIHRDIKPGNIMINSAGEIKVLDFGLAAQIHTSMSRVSMAYHGTSGTGPYMAPEQWRGRIQNAAADQYALAVMAYEMLAGHLPFENPDAAVLQQAVLTQEAEEIPDVPKTVRSAIKCAMRKEAAERFETCTDFADALEGKKIKSVNCKSLLPKLAVAAALILLTGSIGYFLVENRNDMKEQIPLPAENREVEEARLAAEKERLQKAEEARLAAEKERLQKAEEARLAAEKERLQKAEEARLAAEKERLQKAEKLRLKKIVQENYRLYSTVKNKKKRIDSLRYDRGETFGTYLDSLQDNFSAAELAWNMNEPYKKDPESANRFYKEADRAADWILVNAPLRSEAQSLQKRVIEQKALADRFDAQKYSLRSYQQAEEYAALADKNYESGNFSPAVKSLQSALTGYRNAYITSRKSFLNECLKSARIALDRKQWDKVKVMAEKIRVINKVQAGELMKSLNQQMEIEKLNQILAAAKKAKAEQKWLDVYKFALEALAMDGTCREAETLKNESEKFCLNEKCAELFFAGKFKEAWNVLEKIPKRSAQTERILGYFYSYGLNLSPVNKKMAFEHYRKSAEMGDLIGKSEYACCLYRGIGCSRDVERAEPIYREIYAPLRKMAESGNHEAQNNLGVMYDCGEGVAKNHREAVKWYRRSAEQGSILAAINLGTCYYLGTGVKKDYNEAVKRFRKGAELGFAFSQVLLGTCYQEGNGVEKDLSAALSWYRRGAEQGDPLAQVTLGSCYSMGTGVKKDYYEAIKWCRRAAEQEWGNAYTALGYFYYSGLGMKKDYDAAFRLFKKGAEKNDVNAFVWLGMCYEYGTGVYFKDRTKAAEWYRKAAEEGNEFAKESLQRLGY